MQSGKNVRKQWASCRAAPLDFFFRYAYDQLPFCKKILYYHLSVFFKTLVWPSFPLTGAPVRMEYPPGAVLYFIVQNVCSDPLSGQGAGLQFFWILKELFCLNGKEDWTAFGLKVIIQHDGK